MLKAKSVINTEDVIYEYGVTSLAAPTELARRKKFKLDRFFTFREHNGQEIVTFKNFTYLHREAGLAPVTSLFTLAEAIPSYIQMVTDRGFHVPPESEGDFEAGDVDAIWAPIVLVSPLCGDIIKARKERIQNDRFYFKDAFFIFEKDQEIVATIQGQKVAGKFKKANLVTTWSGTYMSVGFETISSARGSIKKTKFYINIPEWEGVRGIKELPIQPLSAEEKLQLSIRGKKIAELLEKPSYVQAEGAMVQYRWMGPKQIPVTGRFMVDSRQLQEIDPDFQWGSYIDRNSNNDDDVFEDNSTVKADNLFMMAPFVYGFSFRAKTWGIITVDQLSPIQFNSQAFDMLVLDPDLKHTIKALVSNSGTAFTDIITGKGGGIISLLHGPPGRGKTLTAEAVAEELHRPLYTISVGELGTDPKSLEDSLNGILKLCENWDAVLLLDEADIFLEERDEKDIVRNAMVGVFLRLLEYHNGVMFLTSNRAKHIDKAFQSRISLIIPFKEADDQFRVEVWRNLLTAAKFKVGVEDITKLSKLNINGRQIKNAIRLAQTTAKSENREPDTKDLEKCVKYCSISI